VEVQLQVNVAKRPYKEEEENMEVIGRQECEQPLKTWLYI
jgi:hypothetical protein